MRAFLKRFYFGLRKIFGVDLLVFLNTCRSLPGFIRDYFQLKQKLAETKDPIPVSINMQMGDKGVNNGELNTHYFQQDLLVAQYIHRANPVKHVDIGSRVDGFVAHVASFREIETLDIRPQDTKIDNIRFVVQDIMAVEEAYKNYCDSVSSLHAFEHFGLGRYGDPINPAGPVVAFSNVYEMLKDNGVFYFSTPIGPYRIEFNAHRVFSIQFLMESLFKDKFTIASFSYIDDRGRLYKNVAIDGENSQDNFGCNFGCGIFTLRKITATTN